MLHRPSFVAEQSSVPLPPLPAYIKLPRGAISAAGLHVGASPHAGKRTRSTGAHKAGLAYQKRISDWLTMGRPPSGLECGPWYWYVDNSGIRHYCQPDFLLHLPCGRLVVVEVKIRWTTDAWWQLRHLYLPVVGRVHPGRELIALTICRSYDPAVRIPEGARLCEGFDLLPSAFNVMVVK